MSKLDFDMALLMLFDVRGKCCQKNISPEFREEMLTHSESE